MKNNEYLLGVLSAKANNYLEKQDYDILLKKNKDEIVDYLYNLDIFTNKTDSFTDACLLFIKNLQEEMINYIGVKNPVYSYFLVSPTNDLYKQLEEMISFNFINKYHLFKNINFLYLLNEISTKDIDLKEYLLTQNIVSDEILYKAFLNKSILDELTLKHLKVKVTNEMSILEIEDHLNLSYQSLLEELAVSNNLMDLSLYYILKKKQELENIKKIYYLGHL